jgi:hypothetical protein
MSFDAVYSYLIGLTWFFLGGWVLLLATAYVLVFTGDRTRGPAISGASRR